MSAIVIRRRRLAAYWLFIRVTADRLMHRAATADFDSKIAERACWWILGIGAAYFVVRGFVSLRWGR